MSARVMNILEGFVPEVEIYSIDEAFLGLDSLEEHYNLYDFGCHIRGLVKQWTGVPVRIGIAPTKTLTKIALNEAKEICDEDEKFCENIGINGLEIIEEIYNNKKDTVNILTHCNAGWLATINWGTATSPIYHAHKKGIPVHVWVYETRPRNQGANLTSYELNEEEIPNTIIADNTGGILMQRGEVDICIVGTDRTLSNGDVCNKIGTYLKALAAHDNNVPFL